MLDEVTSYLLNAKITGIRHIDSDISLILDEHKLWVHVPWRLEKDDRIVIGYENLLELLHHEDYKCDYEEAKEFIAKELIGTTIKEVKYTDLFEVILVLDNHYTFRSFQTNGGEEDDGDNFQLYISKQRYLGTPKGIEIEDLGPFYKG